jgi:hypothetical protein
VRFAAKLADGIGTALAPTRICSRVIENGPGAPTCGIGPSKRSSMRSATNDDEPTSVAS